MIDVKERETMLTQALDKIRDGVTDGKVRGFVITSFTSDGGVGTTQAVAGLSIAEVLGAIAISKSVVLSKLETT